MVRGGGNTQLRKAFANVLGSTDSHATAVHVKPASALQSSRFSLDYLLLPPRSALTAAPGRPTPRTVRATATILLLTATWRADTLQLQRLSMGSSLQRHPFSGLVDSAGELLHTP